MRAGTTDPLDGITDIFECVTPSAQELQAVWKERSLHSWTLDLAWLDLLGITARTRREP